MFQRDLKERDLSSIIRLSPSLPSMASAVAEIFLHLQWKTAAIIGTGKSLSLSRSTQNIAQNCYKMKLVIEQKMLARATINYTEFLNN